MPPHSKLSRSRTVAGTASIAYLPVLDFLIPTQHQRSATLQTKNYSTSAHRRSRRHDEDLESFFFSALTQASTCTSHQRRLWKTRDRFDPRTHKDKSSREILARRSYTTAIQNASKREAVAGRESVGGISGDYKLQSNRRGEPFANSETRTRQKRSQTSHTGTMRWLNSGHNEARATSAVRSWFPSGFFSNTYDKEFAESSRLPPDFFGDLQALRDASSSQSVASQGSIGLENETAEASINRTSHGSRHKSSSKKMEFGEQLKLMENVRELEQRLANAKQNLQTSMLSAHTEAAKRAASAEVATPKEEVTLTKEDYMNLVDLYYYSQNSRFSPESTDLSPTPSFMDDYSFKLSADFSAPEQESINEDEMYESPLRHIDEKLREMKSREVAVMQVFVDLLLDDDSSNRALYEAYKALPEPGVAYLPIGTIRLFLQRMSTPWTRSEKSMLRYLSLIDDMQKAKLPISKAEWSSAVYLAGRSFAKVTDKDVAAAFDLWREMEVVAGVRSSHVTFNILFDIAVRAGKFALGQTILMEMSKRDLRLNRLGRVSLIYYHGLRGDGDGIRKTYRDFVEAGEIVDTLVLNCVIAALLNAQEPEAAEQIYERMKSMNQRARERARKDETDPSFVRYPPPGDNRIDNELASQSLSRILLRAPHLRTILPEHHAALQDSMPLAPDFVTFRVMLSYHAATSGDLDRLSVLLHEMTEIYNLPLRSLVFQILFKGFALHGPSSGPDGPWSRKRLDLCWEAFRQAVKNTRLRGSTDEVVPPFDPVLPSMKEVNAIPPNAPIPAFKPYLHNPPQRRLSGWHEFVLDLAAFPKERLRRIQRFHGQIFDDENMKKPHEKNTPHTFVSPFFQSTIYQAPEPTLDHEEGEYVLPNPTTTMVPQHHLRTQAEESRNPSYDERNTNSEPSDHGGPHDLKPNFSPYSSSNLQPSYRDDHPRQQQHQHQHQNQRQYQDEDEDDDIDDHTHTHTHEPPDHDTNHFYPHQFSHDPDSPIIVPTRHLIYWLLRAYARNYKSRTHVEQVWGAVRKMYKPKDALERESVVRVLRRCLRDCDREGR